MKVQISQQSFFDFVNKADKEGTPYSFVRTRSVNQTTAEWCVNLISDELGLTITISLKEPTPTYCLEV